MKPGKSHLLVLNIFFMLIFTSSLLFAQDPALDRLNNSPRHHEWVAVKNGDRTVHAFLVYPEVNEKVPAVLVIHENRGLTDWVRGVADQLAEAGYIAIAPDLLSGHGPEGGKTSDFSDRNAARDALYKLPPDQVTADLRAVGAFVRKLPASDSTLAVGGFCWGGSQTFRFAGNGEQLKAAFVFYGTAPKDDATLEKIHCPVYGFYGENDARVTSTVEETARRMKAQDKVYAPVIYDGAGHGFMRSGEAEDADPANKSARDTGWERWLDLLRKM